MLFVCSDAKGKHSLSVFAVDCGSPFVAPSVILVNTGKDRGAMNKRKPGNRRWSPADLQGAWKSLRRLERGQRIAVAGASRSGGATVLRCVRMRWGELSAESKGCTITHRLNPSRRLCSATSPGHESKRPSRTTILERKSSTLCLMVMVPCRCLGQEIVFERRVISELGNWRKR